ncbi:MAG TPA: penicillin-insensitive murein endopeptidase [Solirubrobacteraceae bacterium]
MPAWAALAAAVTAFAGGALLGAGRPSSAAPLQTEPPAAPAQPQAAPPTGPPLQPASAPASVPRYPARPSRAIGTPTHGRLVRGVLLPAAGSDYVTWDFVLKRSPNRAWRRWGTDRLVRTLLAVLRAHRAAFPDAPPLVVGDLSRPHGGDFGVRFGGHGHLSHQNGLDVDVYYPRRDGVLRPPLRVAQIDHRRAADLVERFLRAGARRIFIGPHTGLRGPRRIVRPLSLHDNHMHVRIRP